MAKNRKFAKGDDIELPVAAGVESGEVVIVGDLVGVAKTDRDADGYASVQLDGAWDVSVDGEVAVGDFVYATLTSERVTAISTDAGAGANPRVGAALEAVAAATTATIAVKILN